MENLRPRERGGLKGEISISDHRFARGDVLQANLKRSNVRLDRVALERPQPAAKNRNIGDRTLRTFEPG